MEFIPRSVPVAGWVAGEDAVIAAAAQWQGQGQGQGDQGGAGAEAGLAAAVSSGNANPGVDCAAAGATGSEPSEKAAAWCGAGPPATGNWSGTQRAPRPDCGASGSTGRSSAGATSRVVGTVITKRLSHFGHRAFLPTRLVLGSLSCVLQTGQGTLMGDIGCVLGGKGLVVSCQLLVVSC